MTCRYQDKRTYPTRAQARAGAKEIRAFITANGGIYQTLYPYRCPGNTHWHLTSSRQGTKPCPSCGERRPAWFDKRSQTWVVYAHDDCTTQAVA